MAESNSDNGNIVVATMMYIPAQNGIKEEISFIRGNHSNDACFTSPDHNKESFSQLLMDDTIQYSLIPIVNTSL